MRHVSFFLWSMSTKHAALIRTFGLIVIALGVTACREATDSTNPKGNPNSDSQTSQDQSSHDSVSSQPSSDDNINSGTKQDTAKEASKIRFEMLHDSGIHFMREDDMRGSCRIFESTGGGVGALDFDRDGLTDLVFMGGCRLPEDANSAKPTCVIYRQESPLKFTDCTFGSSLLKSGYCQGIAIGDMDNDGFEDVYITALGPNGFFHNNGDGTFTDLTNELGLEMGEWSTSCAMADLNLDGNLDLYVVTYLEDSITEPLLCTNPKSPTGYEQCPPSKYNGVDDRVFLNDGSGGMIDVTTESGLSGTKGKGLGLTICDLDRDGKQEIYVANDGEANFLFEITIDENRRIKLEDIALTSGCALSRSGYAQASMGVAVGDYDNNGTLDLHLTNFYGDTNTIYKNSGGLKFTDVTRTTGITGPSKSVLGWGTVFSDFDNDGWLDLFVANGHVEDRRWAGRGEPFEMPPLLLRNTGKGTFEDVSKDSGDYFQKNWLGRGVVNIDLNHDGLDDLIMSHQHSIPQILINQSKVPAFPEVNVIGVKSNRSGIGVKLEYLGKSGELVAFQELYGGGSYLSAGSRAARLPSKDVDQVRIYWPSGRTETISFNESPIVEFVEY